MKVTVVINDADVPPGHLSDVLSRRDFGMEDVRLDEGASLPDLSTVEAIVVMGGEMGAYDTDRYSYLIDEKRFLAGAVALGIPVLGICLGCQLLADALGGSAHLADEPEYHLGPIEVIRSDATVDVLAGGASFSLHRDTWDLPPGGVLVGRTNGFNHAFRLGSALGIQSHPELKLDTLQLWLEMPEGEELAFAAGTDSSSIIENFTRQEADTVSVATGFFDAWLDEISRRSTAAATD